MLNSFNNNAHTASKKTQQRKRGRICRIEELENREMLDAGLMSALDDIFNMSSSQPLNDTIIVDNNTDGLASPGLVQNTAQVAQAALAPPAQAAGAPVGSIATTKIAVDKAYTSANTIGLSVAGGAGVSTVTNGYSVAVNGAAATGLSYVTEKGGIVTHGDYLFGTHGTIKSIIITEINGSALNANTKYEKIVVSAADSAKEIKSAATTKYAAIKMKADVKGAIINEEFNKPYAIADKVCASPYQTTIDSFTLTWAKTQPMGETFNAITLTAGKEGKPGYAKLELVKNAQEKWIVKPGTTTPWFGEVTEGDAWTGKAGKPQTLVNFLQITGLQANLKYTVELGGCKYGTTSLAGKAPTVSVATAKWAAPKPDAKSMVVGADTVTLHIAIPDTAKPVNYAAKPTYDWFALYGALPGGSKVDTNQFLGLVLATVKDSKTVTIELNAAFFKSIQNVEAAKAYTVFVNAVTIGDGVNKETVVNESAQGKFAFKKGADGTEKVDGLKTKAADIPKISAITVSETNVTLEWGAISGAAGYQIQYRKLDAKGKPAGDWNTTLPDVAATDTTATVAGLDESTRYEFQVRTGVTGGTPGAWSTSAFKTSKYVLEAVNDLAAVQLVGPGHIKGSNFVTNVTYTQPAHGTTTLYWIDTNALATHYGGDNTFAGNLDDANALNAAKAAIAAEALKNGTLTGWTAMPAGEFSYPLPDFRMYTGLPNAWVYFACVTKEDGLALLSTNIPSIRISEVVDQSQHWPDDDVKVMDNGDGTYTIDWRNTQHAALYGAIRAVTPQYKDASGQWKNCNVLATTYNDGYLASIGIAGRPDDEIISVKVTAVPGATEFRVFTFAGDLNLLPGNETEWASVDYNVMIAKPITAANNLGNSSAYEVGGKGNIPTKVQGNYYVADVSFAKPVIGTTTLYYIEIATSNFDGWETGVNTAKDAAIAALTGGDTSSWTAVSPNQLTVQNGKYSYEYKHAVPAPGNYDNHHGTPNTVTVFVCVTKDGSNTAISSTYSLNTQNVCDQISYFGPPDLAVSLSGGKLTIDWRLCKGWANAGRTPMIFVVPQYKDAAGQWQNFPDFEQGTVGEGTGTSPTCTWGELNERGKQPAYATVSDIPGATEFRILSFNGGDWDSVAGTLVR